MRLNNQQLFGQCEKHLHWLSDSVGIHKDMYAAWLSLYNAALSQNLELSIASGFRSFDRQLSIWNRKFNGELPVKNKLNQTVNIHSLTEEEKVKAILLFSALPGASRHHWGTDIDIFASNLLPNNEKLQLEPWEYQQGGPFEKLTHWLTNNAHKHGFFLPYDTDRGGVAIEPWHLSFKPLSEHCLCDVNIKTLHEKISNANILGKTAILQDLPSIFSQYIQNINKG